MENITHPIALSPLVSNGAVFQRNREIVIFGRGEGTLFAEFLGETREAVARDGYVELRFPARAAGGPYDMRIVRNGEETTLRDLYIGDVVLLAGQSNLQMQLADTGRAVDGDADDPLARVYHARRIERDDAFDDRWNEMTAENALNWSAVAYHLARTLRKKRGVPIGMVCCYQGAAVIQSFLSPEANARFVFDPAVMHPDHTNETYIAWNRPSTIYHEMLRPLFPCPLSAAVWYQGESNSAPAEGARYGDMLRALIEEMRAGFQTPNLPFAVVRINDFLTPFSQEGWKLVQDAQTRAAREIPGVRLVTVDDMGQAELIHPTNKREVASRIADALEGL